MNNTDEILAAYKNAHNLMHKLWGQAKDGEYMKRDWCNFDLAFSGIVSDLMKALGYSGPLLR